MHISQGFDNVIGFVSAFLSLCLEAIIELCVQCLLWYAGLASRSIVRCLIMVLRSRRALPESVYWSTRFGGDKTFVFSLIFARIIERFSIHSYSIVYASATDLISLVNATSSFISMRVTVDT